MVNIMDKESLLTQEYLKYILHYNPETYLNKIDE